MKAIINGNSLAYDDVGTGPAVVLIHGFPLCRQMWHPQMKVLEAAGYRVIVPDLRGFGESETTEEQVSMDVYADDIAGLLDHLGVEKAVVGGMSMGGYVLLNFLERYVQRAVAAVFIVTRSGAEDKMGRAKRTAMAGEVQHGRPQVVTDVFGGILFAEETANTKPELVAEVKNWMISTDPRGLVGGLLSMRDRKDYTSVLETFKLPALVVGARQDRAIPSENTDLLARGLPESTLCFIHGAGHMVNMERPEDFNSCLVDFLDNLPQ